MIATFGTPEWYVFWGVVMARLLLPLAIPRFPFPAIIGCMLLDAADQTIFQQFPGLQIQGYQGYDKALDTYYLAVAYIATLRNWSNLFAYKINRFLFYWRLVGVALFELTHLRLLLFIFPNTFEYFFIFVEMCRLRRDPKRLSKKMLIWATAAIWIVIKLPQEYWIHIAQTDTTDWLKSALYRVPLDTSWGSIVTGQPWISLAIVAVVVLVVAAVCWLARRRLPPITRKLALSADAYHSGFTTKQVRLAVAEEAREIFDWALLEKAVLVTLVSFCFGQVLSDIRATEWQFILAIALLVVVNTALSHWLARLGFGWAFTIKQFLVLGAVNSVLMVAYGLLRARFDQPVSVLNASFFVLLLTFLITLYDRYRQVYIMRHGVRPSLKAT